MGTVYTGVQFSCKVTAQKGNLFGFFGNTLALQKTPQIFCYFDEKCLHDKGAHVILCKVHPLSRKKLLEYINAALIVIAVAAAMLNVVLEAIPVGIATTREPTSAPEETNVGSSKIPVAINEI